MASLSTCLITVKGALKTMRDADEGLGAAMPTIKVSKPYIYTRGACVYTSASRRLAHLLDLELQSDVKILVSFL